MAFSNIGSVEDQSVGINIGSSNPISFVATIPDLAANEYLTMEIDQIGSSVAGSDLVVIIIYNT